MPQQEIQRRNSIGIFQFNYMGVTYERPTIYDLPSMTSSCCFLLGLIAINNNFFEVQLII